MLAANNAEMRGGAGMPLSGGVVTIEDGDIEFGDFVQLAYQQCRATRTSTTRRSLAEHLLPVARSGESFLETAVSPNFPVTGPIYQRHGRESLGFGPGRRRARGRRRRAAQACSRSSGPVELDGVTYDAANVEQQVLNENYLRFDDHRASAASGVERAGQRWPRRSSRRSRTRDVPVADLAVALREAAQGRHLLA